MLFCKNQKICDFCVNIDGIPLFIPTIKNKIRAAKGGFFFLSLHSRKTPCNEICHSRHIYLSRASIGLLRFRIPLFIPTMKHKIPVFRRGFDISLVGNEGFEPPMPESESGALPLGEFPIKLVRRGLYEKNGDTQIFLSLNIFYN